MTQTAISQSGLPIRLTGERWTHITEEHGELAGYHAQVLETIEAPERVLAGTGGELLATRTQLDGKLLVVVYRELSEDGFVITAFLTRRTSSLNRRKQVWP
jgi:hypothetical protein